MKRVFLVLPLSILLVNCSSTHNTATTSTNTNMNASIGTAASTGVNANASTTVNGMSTSASTGGSMSTSSNQGSTSAAISNWNSNAGTMQQSSGNGSNSNVTASSSGAVNWDVYDPNNYMQNPEKYRKPYELVKTGGWTYDKDWRRNTNFTPDAVGAWQLVLTPEVAGAWLPDTRRPETYASYWTPESVMARYQASMAAAARTKDSLAALTAAANPRTSGRKTMKGRTSAASAGMTASATTNGTPWASGSGTTGAVGSGGSASMDMNAATGSSTANSSVTTPFLLTAVNGNNFMLPTLNMFIDNGSFTAFTGCNSAVGNIIVNGSSLHFEEATPSTNVECIGGFDQSQFIDRLRRADSYDVVNNQFRLKQGDQVLMVFQKNAQ